MGRLEREEDKSPRGGEPPRGPIGWGSPIGGKEISQVPAAEKALRRKECTKEKKRKKDVVAFVGNRKPNLS